MVINVHITLLGQFMQWRVSEFEANVTDLNKFCDVLPHGYAVSSEDFDNETEFREIVRRLSPKVPVRVPARRDPRSREKPSEECKPHKDPKAYGRFFFHADEAKRYSRFRWGHFKSSHHYSS
ncbi:hypothetical protein COOONC_26621 [Cooperia oncophora]